MATTPIIIRPALPTDRAFLIAHDPHISAARMDTKIAAREVLVLTSAAQPVGWLRWGWFWDAVPFMNNLHILPDYRRRGLARRLVTTWEAIMRDQGMEFVLTSSYSHEDGQHFYRACGYQDIGGLILPHEPLELVLYKVLLPEGM